MESGAWLVLEHANLCSATVLDRLNSLMEEDGELVLSECGTGKDGTARVLRRHPNFRLFLTMNPTFGPISRPMRNRCVWRSVFVFFVCCFFGFFALVIDLLTDQVTPLSRCVEICFLSPTELGQVNPSNPSTNSASSDAVRLLHDCGVVGAPLCLAMHRAHLRVVRRSVVC